MKKVLVTFVALVMLLGVTSQAKTKMSWGPKAGASLANWIGSDVSGTDAKLGLSAGAFLGIDVANQIRFQPELLYVMKGLKATESGVDVKVKLNYLEVPVLIKWMIPTQGTVDPSLFVGLAPAFNMSAKANGSFGGGSLEVDIKDIIKNIDFGAVFGGGVDFAAGTGSFGFDVRYTMGLSSIDDSGSDANIKNAAWSAMFAYTMPIGQ